MIVYRILYNLFRKIQFDNWSDTMPQTVEELEQGACKYWSESIINAVVAINPIPILLATQDKFISILKCADQTPTAWLNVLNNSELSPNLFLKHLVVLTDIGGERLQRYCQDFDVFFPKHEFQYSWRGKEYVYKFKDITPTWTNSNLQIDKHHLSKTCSITASMKDVIMLLLWGSSIINNPTLPTELIDKCCVGQFIGLPKELEDFVKQRYIIVSRITGGSTANDSGHVCETLCKERLSNLLPSYYKMDAHNIHGVTQNNKDLTTFDLVVENSNNGKCCAIEISFQVTTNSVIERKASLAKERQQLLHEAKHFVAYIIDGVGNFQRKNAVQTILNFSDCSVNFSDNGITTLAQFIKDHC